MKDDKKAGLVIIPLMVLLILFGGVLYFWCGYLDGLILKWLIGDWIVKAFNVFNLNVSKDQIPLAFALIGLVSGFFKTSTTAFKKDK